ncbi:hypothetical protein D9M69_615940 [compost metagenome]
MPQQGRQGRDHQDQRQHLEGEGEQRSLVLHRIGLIAAGKEAEDEPGPLLGRQFQAPNRVVDAVQNHLRAGDGEGRQHQGRLHQNRPHRQPPGERLAVLGDRPADGDDDDQAEQALEVQEAEHGKAAPRPALREPASQLCLNDRRTRLARGQWNTLSRWERA